MRRRGYFQLGYNDEDLPNEVPDYHPGEPRRSQRIAKNNFKRFKRELDMEGGSYSRVMKHPKPCGLFGGGTPVVPLSYATLCQMAPSGPSTSSRQLRGTGVYGTPMTASLAPYLSKRLPERMRERHLDLGSVDKVFAATWLDDRQVILGTKSNEVLVLDVTDERITRIPSLKSTLPTTRKAMVLERRRREKCLPCGIHSLAINPSRTRLATGGENTNDLAIYKLPSFDPAMVGQNGHQDWIFDMVWVDDEFVVTGSRDGRLALWLDHSSDEERAGFDRGNSSKYVEGVRIPEYECVPPTMVTGNYQVDIVRALAYNQPAKELGVLSLNSKIHLWDMTNFKHKSTRVLAKNKENVCMTFDPYSQVYAVGSQSYVSLIDSRSLGESLCIESPQPGTGIRSVSFNDRVLNIGTGSGYMFFYDLTAGKYIPDPNLGKPLRLCVGSGYLKEDETWRDYFSAMDYKNAIYTHCYDSTRTRLFTAGGPLPTCLWGNYAAVWQ